MEIKINYAGSASLAWLLKSDTHMSGEKLRRKLKNKEVLIAKSPDGPFGFLRFGYFWDEIPFMNMLIVSEPKRGQGIGTRLVRFWESEMKQKGHQMVLTSTMSNENAQHFYRKLGYRDSGALLLPDEALEIILIKEL